MHNLNTDIKELDIVTLRHDLPEHDLKQGSRGAVVHCYGDGQAFEVEFVAETGDTIALVTLTPSDIQYRSHDSLCQTLLQDPKTRNPSDGRTS